MAMEKVDKPVNMFVLFAQFFSILAKNLEKKYGAEGLDLLKETVIEWGVARGKDIAHRAAQSGKTNDLEAYLPSYDMERSELFGAETKYTPDEIHQDFDRCVFAQTWIDAGEENMAAFTARISIRPLSKATMRIWNASMTTSCTKMGIALSVLEKEEIRKIKEKRCS